MFLHYLAKRETRTLHFSLDVLMHYQNSTSRYLISSMFWLTTHPQAHAAVWLPKSCNKNAFSLEMVFFWGGGMVQKKRSQERCSSWTVLHAQSTSALSSGFPLSQDNDEALDRWGGKAKHHLISYFLSNTSATNYRNRVVYVKIIASQRWDVFETQCTKWPRW